MNQIKQAQRQYQQLERILGDLKKLPDHQRIDNEPWMYLSVENNYTEFQGMPVISMAHYYEQNGDLISDPDMTIALNHEHRMAFPLTLQNCLGSYWVVYPKPGFVDRRQDREQSSFLGMWLRNLINQKFPEARKKNEKSEVLA